MKPMSRWLRPVLLLLAGMVGTMLQSAEPAPAPAADELYGAAKDARGAQFAWQQWPTESPEQKSAREAERWRANDAVVQAAGNFLAAHPADPRRWEVLAMLAGAERKFTGPTAKADEIGWQAFRRETQDRLLNSEGVPDAIWERAMWSEVLRVRRLVEEEQKRAGRADPAPWRAALDRFSARTPRARSLGPFEGHYAEFLLKQEPAAGERHLQALAGSRNPEVAAMSRGKLNALAAAHGPMELKFTAADGREVDLAKLRGKVVIIDFWATWCVPCLKEFPNTKAAYDAYRDQGVEMIGISFDRAPKDPAKPAKSERTREQFLADAAKLGMDWPQYYDGKGWECELGLRYNIVTIPRIWVLNKEGVLQTQFASGRTLWDLLAKLTGHTVPIPPEFQKKSDEATQ
jgi:thiol-disulfide isomerase/thioredoxin